MVTFEGERAPAFAKGTIGEVELIAMLGDTTETPLHLEAFSWLDGNAPVLIADGHFTLTSICEEGGSRLIDLSGDAALKSIHPNPAGTIAEIDYAVIEAGRTQLYLSDPLGRRVATIIDGDLTRGDHTATLDVRGLPSGIYLLTLETPTMRSTRRVDVVR